MLKLRDLMMPPAGSEVYLALEWLEGDLHSLIHSSRPLPDEHIQRIVHQMLRGLKAIHAANVVHKDLKPSNLLVSATCDLRICNFSAACSGARGGTQGQLGETTAARPRLSEYMSAAEHWYCAPEQLVEETQSCDERLDMWSAALVLAEMLGRKALLQGPARTRMERMPGPDEL